MTWQELSDDLVVKPGWRLEPHPRPCWCFGPTDSPRLRVIEEPDGYVVRDQATDSRHQFATLGALLAWIKDEGIEEDPTGMGG
jgi:hypothetical protein